MVQLPQRLLLPPAVHLPLLPALHGLVLVGWVVVPALRVVGQQLLALGVVCVVQPVLLVVGLRIQTPQMLQLGIQQVGEVLAAPLQLLPAPPLPLVTLLHVLLLPQLLVQLPLVLQAFALLQVVHSNWYLRHSPQPCWEQHPLMQQHHCVSTTTLTLP